MPTNSSFLKWVFGGEMLEDAKTWPRQLIGCFLCMAGFKSKLNLEVIYDEGEIDYCPGIKYGVKKVVAGIKKARSEFKIVYFSEFPMQCLPFIVKLFFLFFPFLWFKKNIEKNDYRVISPYADVPDSYKTGNVIDATCANVWRVINTAKKWHDLGYKVIIAGEENEWEPRIINAHIQNEGMILEYAEKNEEILENLGSKIAIVSQTSFRQDLFFSNIRKIKEKNPLAEIIVENKNCPAIEKRVESALKLSKYCDMVVVLGSQNSNQGNYIASRLLNAGVRVLRLDYVGKTDSYYFRYCKRVGLVSVSTIGRDDFMKAVKDIKKIEYCYHNFNSILSQPTCHGCPDKFNCHLSTGYCTACGDFHDACPKK